MTRTTPARPLDVVRVFPAIAPFGGMATRLHPRPGEPSSLESSVGGPLLWPVDEPWLVCTEPHRRNRGEVPENIRARRRILADSWDRIPDPGARRGPTGDELQMLEVLEKRVTIGSERRDNEPIPLLAVAQIYKRDVPDMPVPDGMDLLQILWCPFDAHGADNGLDVRLKWRRSEDVAGQPSRREEPEVVGSDGYFPQSCVLHPERVAEFPDIEVLPVSLQEQLEAVPYQLDLSIAPGWKVAGFPSWHLTGPVELNCDCGAPMDLLLSMDSKEWDRGNRSWVPMEDMDRIGRHHASRPTELIVGRAGQLRMFVCSVDPLHPYRLDEQ
ncbi:hypothetical protein LNW72_08520 [Streptomyces sp. RKAG293]|nr:hypothetical protein [Streptomyces sp. RKAG293]